MKKVFMLSYGDGGMLGIYSSAKKAIEAAKKSFEDRNMQASGSQVAIALSQLKESHGSARLLAAQATDQYDEAKTLTIQKWSVL